MIIRKLRNKEIPTAIKLVWKVFLEYEAPDYSEEGINEFKKTINDQDWLKSRDFYGAFDNNILLGVIATFNSNHISLFFVEGKYHRRGIGRDLYKKVKELNKSGFFTVNSSPYAHDIYKHLGFIDTNKEQCINGLKFYPMLANIKNKYVRVMDGLKSNASGFEYKIDMVNIATKWSPTADNPEDYGGFNFSTEDKILRWLHRGDTIYDVIIPNDADAILCDIEKGVYRANKIIVTNPRPITDNMVIELYRKTTLSNKVLAQCLVTLLWRNRIEISKLIVREKVNKNNITEFITEFVNYAGEKYLSSELTKEIYNMLIEIKKSITDN